MRIFTIARSVQPFLEKDKQLSPEDIYRSIISNKNLSFIRSIVSANDFPILVFCTYEIYKGNNNPNILPEIENNLFIFTELIFGEEGSEYDCTFCDGEGTYQCQDCYGSGQDECGNCYGSGKVECPDCEGDGLVNLGDELNCETCRGEGEVDCEQCDGEGSTECHVCSGYGQEDCDKCDGSGSITYENEILVEVRTYCSYNTSLKMNLEMNVLRNSENPEHNFFDDSVLLIHVNEYIPGQDDITREINTDFAGQTFIGEIIDKENMDLKYLTNGKINRTTFRNIPDRFLD